MAVSRRGALVVGGSLLFGGCLDVRPTRTDIAANEDTFTVAHRGSMVLWPENTIRSVQRSIETGADMVEIDLDVTADDTIVVIHDETVDRTTDGEGPIADMTLAEAKTLDAGYHFPPELPEGYRGADPDHEQLPPDEPHPFRGEGIEIPTLEEVFEAVPSDYPLLLDVKRERPSPARIADLVAQYDRADSTLVGAFETPFLRRMREEMPALSTGLGGSETRQFFATHRANEPRYDHPAEFLFAPHGTVRPSIVDRAHRNGMSVLPWTVNAPPEMRRLIDAGVDGILTDDHVLLETVRGESD